MQTTDDPRPRPRRLPDLVRRPATRRDRRRPAGAGDRGRPVQPDLRGHRRHVVVDRAAPAARPRAGDRPRHGPRVHRDERPRRRPTCRCRRRTPTAPTPTCSGAPFYVMERILGTAYRNRTQLEPLGPERTATIAGRMIDVLAEPARRRPGGGRARRVRPARPASSSARCAGGASSSRDRRPASTPTPRSCTGCSPRACPPTTTRRSSGSCTATTASTTCSPATTTRSRPSSTGRWRPSATPAPTWRCCSSTTGSRSLPGSGLVSDVSTAPGYPDTATQLERYAAASGRDLGDMGVPPRARLLQARGDPRGHQLPLPAGPDRRRGLRPDRRRLRPADRRRPRRTRPRTIED